MVFDSHAHIFPFLGGKGGLNSVDTHLLYAQRCIHRNSAQPARRLVDNAEVTEKGLWDEDVPGKDGKTEVTFRVGDFGRYLWTVGAEDYYFQYMPPQMQSMEAPPELLIALMDYAGVDKAVLQQGFVYGRLNEFHSEAVKKYPTRLKGLAQIDEARAGTAEELADLERNINGLGLSGLYYEMDDLFTRDFLLGADDQEFDEFWALVESLNIPVFWSLATERYMTCFEEIATVIEKHPALRSVLVMSVPRRILRSIDGAPSVPSRIVDLVAQTDTLLEVCYPISHGYRDAYPYRDSIEDFEAMYDAVGPSKLVWGSDIPNVERFCTYRQARSYLDHGTKLPAADRNLILGGNLEALFS